MKFRIPILTRTPLITRKSVFHRVPIITRHSIYQRSAIHSHYASGIGCTITDTDCSGTKFGKPCEKKANLILFNFKSGDIDWDKQVVYAKLAQEREQIIRVITEVPLREDFIYAIGYSSKNTVQYSINVVENTEIPTILRKNMKRCKDSGIYTAIVLYSIIPTITHSYDVLLILESLKYVCSHVCLKFYESYPSKVMHNKTYCMVSGHKIPKKYMTYKSGHLQCSKLFIQSFIETIENYAVPNKLKYSVCNNQFCYWGDVHGKN